MSKSSIKAVYLAVPFPKKKYNSPQLCSQYIAVYEKKKYFAVCDTNTSIGNYRRCILFTFSSVIVCYVVFFIVVKSRFYQHQAEN